MDTSQVWNSLSHMGTPNQLYFNQKFLKKRRNWLMPLWRLSPKSAELMSQFKFKDWKLLSYKKEQIFQFKNCQENSLLLGVRQWAFFFFSFYGHTIAYGGSQARGQIGAVATGLHHSHSNARPEPCL